MVAKSGWKIPWAPLALALLCLLYLAVMAPVFRQYSFGYDDFYFFRIGEKLPSIPGLLWAQDYGSRYHPLYYLVLAVAYSLFKLEPLGYGCINLTVHVACACLLYRLLRRLALSEGGALVGAAVFLFLSSQWFIVFQAPQIWRLGVALFLLLTFDLFLGFLETGKMRDYVLSLIFFLAAFGFGEDGIGFPLLFLFAAWEGKALKTKRGPWRRLVWVVPYFAMSLAYGLFNAWRGGVRDSPLDWGLHFLATPLYFLKEYVHLLWIPRAEFVSHLPVPTLAARILPLLVFFLLAALLLKRRDVRLKLRDLLGHRAFLFGIVFAVAAMIPYLMIPKPLGEEAWPRPRYLYLPGIGGAAILGSIFQTAWDSARRRWTVRLILLGMVAYTVLLSGTTTAYVARRRYASTSFATPQEAPLAYAFFNQLREHIPIMPEDASLVIENPPFAIDRLRTLLATYYGMMPAELSEKIGEGEGPLFVLRWTGSQLEKVRL